MKNLLVVFALAHSLSLFGKDAKYPVASISENLLNDVSSVVRLDRRLFDIKDPGKAFYTIEYAVTILDESAYERAIFSVAYDKMIKLKNIKATIYDKYGEVVKKINDDDITDMSLMGDLSSFDDNRVKYFDPEYKFFPFTVEYSYELQFSGLLSYPDWSPYQHYKESVEYSSMTVVADKGFEFRYFQKNGAPEPAISEDDARKTYKWELTNLSAEDYQFFIYLDDQYPTVYLAPNEFEYGGEHGFSNTWQEFGSWIAKLNEGGNNLSEEAKTEIKALVLGVNDPQERIEILYDYMQNKTRYVSIALGIGGLKPFDANTVERLGYGDCKALTNYMKSILEVVDIPSNYVLVLAGEYESNIIADFPSNQFNHVFLMVPLEEDTVWLECTDQQGPFNYHGAFTDDRDVLVIEDGEGKIVRTPAYNEKNNYEKRVVNVDLDTEGNAMVSATTSYVGAKYHDVFGFLFEDKKTIENALNRRIDIKDFTISSFNYTDKKSEIAEDLNLQVIGYAKKNKNNLIMSLNLMNKVTGIPKKDDERTLDVFIRRSYSEIDQITYKIPANYHIGSNPEPVTIESKFGKYNVKIEQNDGSIEYHREFVFYKGTYPPSDYNNLIDFLSEVAKADRMKVMLVSGT